MNANFFRNIALASAVAICLLPSIAAGQGTTGGAAGDAASAAKKPDAGSKATPRTADGHPDLNGVWHHSSHQGEFTPAKPGESLAFGVSGAAPAAARPAAAPPPPSKPQYKAEFVEKVADLDKRQNETDQTLRCGPPGVPRLGPPHQIVQTPGQVVFLYNDLTGEYFRVIPTNGQAHHQYQEASFNGDSVGRWEGDTLVVDTNNLIDESWLGDNGLIHSDKLHVIERFQRNGDTIQYRVTVEDPAMLIKPWVMNPRTLNLQNDILEEAPPCVDKDIPHLTDLSHHGNAR